MKKLLDYIKKYPMCLALAGICLTLGSMVFYQINESRKLIEPKCVTEEQLRDSSSEGINHPKGMMEYFLKAILEQDLDMALRGMAIDERVLGVSVGNIINENRRFYIDMTIAPSGSYSEYNEIASAELVGRMSEGIQDILDQFPDAGRLHVKSINYVRPETQMSREYLSQSQQIMECWGGDDLCEVSALLVYDGKDYILGLTLVHYGDYWKIFSVGSKLAGTTEENAVRVITEKEYEELKGEISESYFEKEKQDQILEDILFEEEDRNPDVENLLLPLNYFVLNPIKAATPEKAIAEFVLSIQKKELVRAMSYCMQAEEAEILHTSLSVLEQQAEAARAVKWFCYSFLGCDYSKGEDSLSEIGKSGTTIRKKLDPLYFMHFDLMEMHLEDELENVRQYTAYCYYEGDYYIYGFTLENAGGWQIKSMSAPAAGLEEGEVRRVTEQEYAKLMEEIQQQ